RYLRLRYVEGAPLAQVCATLGIGERQARREHRAALQELAGLLLDPSFQSARPVPTGSRAEAPSAPPEADASDAPRAADRDDAGLDAELGQIEPTLEPIELPSAFDDALRLAERLVAAHAVEIQRFQGDGRFTVLATRTILRQVLLNLLSYLIDLPGARQVEITLREVGATVEADLVAPGVEIPSGVASPALGAARRLAEGEQGSLRVEQVGDGARARLSLLSSQASIILVVDDNPDLVRLFRRYLRGEGFRLLQARNAIRAQQVARSLRLDAIILDLMMPVQDGWDFLRALRSDPATADIPIVACSVLPERELALSLQARDFLAKPVTPEALLTALEPYRRVPLPIRE
ncbi:MAG: response regulator, partial [Chloroflexota bacterium]